MTQYAVFNIDGDQIIGSVGDKLELAKQSTEEGAVVTIDQVLLIGNKEADANEDATTLVGKPVIEGASIELKIEKHTKGEKIRIIKFRRRQHSKRQYGHRQEYTQATLTAIHSPA